MTLADQVAALARLTTAELAAEYQRLHGRRPRYRSVPWMRKRIAHRLQVAAYGGLTRTARAVVDELAADVVLPAARPSQPAAPGGTALRPGTTLERVWHGQIIRVEITSDGATYDGQRFASLSAVARHVTGQHWSGPRFFNLTKRTRKA